MDKAFTFRGGRIVQVMACEITNTQEARDLRPFFDDQPVEVNYVSSCLRREVINVAAHFRHPLSNKSLRQRLEEDINHRLVSHGESQVHSAAKEMIASGLDEHLRKRIPLPWRLTDRQISDFDMSGDLLSEVVTVKPEHTIITPYGFTFRADIALLGPSICIADKSPAPVLLGLIEIEYKHRFELLKCLAVKSLGVPLISVDIAHGKQQISEEWGHHVLHEMYNLESANKRTHLYLPSSLYPTFLDIPTGFSGGRHEFVIFVKDESYNSLLFDLDRWKRALSLHDNHVRIVPVNMKGNEDPAIVRTVNALGPLAGPDWREYNVRRFIRVQCAVPQQRKGNLYLFHLAKAALSGSYDILLGYKYRIDADVFMKDPLWQGKDPSGNIVRIAPKSLSETFRLFRSIL